jgi:hypothetical protein
MTLAKKTLLFYLFLFTANNCFGSQSDDTQLSREFLSKLTKGFKSERINKEAFRITYDYLDNYKKAIEDKNIEAFVGNLRNNMVWDYGSVEEQGMILDDYIQELKSNFKKNPDCSNQDLTIISSRLLPFASMNEKNVKLVDFQIFVLKNMKSCKLGKFALTFLRNAKVSESLSQDAQKNVYDALLWAQKNSEFYSLRLLSASILLKVYNNKNDTFETFKNTALIKDLDVLNPDFKELYNASMDNSSPEKAKMFKSKLEQSKIDIIQHALNLLAEIKTKPAFDVIKEVSVSSNNPAVKEKACQLYADYFKK